MSGRALAVLLAAVLAASSVCAEDVVVLGLEHDRLSSGERGLTMIGARTSSVGERVNLAMRGEVQRLEEAGRYAAHADAVIALAGATQLTGGASLGRVDAPGAHYWYRSVRLGAVRSLGPGWHVSLEDEYFRAPDVRGHLLAGTVTRSAGRWSAGLELAGTAAGNVDEHYALVRVERHGRVPFRVGAIDGRSRTAADDIRLSAVARSYRGLFAGLSLISGRSTWALDWSAMRIGSIDRHAVIFTYRRSLPR